MMPLMLRHYADFRYATLITYARFFIDAYAISPYATAALLLMRVIFLRRRALIRCQMPATLAFHYFSRKISFATPLRRRHADAAMARRHYFHYFSRRFDH